LKEGESIKGYKGLKVYQLAHELAIRVHEMTLELPKFEMYEEGSQIRRSSKSVSSNIVEGYSLRKYKNEFLHYLYRSYAESLETVEHLEYLYETKSLMSKETFNSLVSGYGELNKMLFVFIQSVEKSHEAPFFIKEDEDLYNIQTLKSEI
jgi:four helix bundle protein